MGIQLDDVEFLSPEIDNAAKEAKQREKVADLIPLADKIKSAEGRVRFNVDTEGANAELERLRTAARLQGFSLRILSREANGAVTTVTVKPGKLIERGKGEGDETADETTPETVTDAPVAKGAKSK
jgi:hypothetical protein